MLTNTFRRITPHQILITCSVAHGLTLLKMSLKSMFQFVRYYSDKKMNMTENLNSLAEAKSKDRSTDSHINIEIARLCFRATANCDDY